MSWAGWQGKVSLEWNEIWAADNPHGDNWVLAACRERSGKPGAQRPHSAARIWRIKAHFPYHQPPGLGEDLPPSCAPVSLGTNCLWWCPPPGGHVRIKWDEACDVLRTDTQQVSVRTIPYFKLALPWFASIWYFLPNRSHHLKHILTHSSYYPGGRQISSFLFYRHGN